MTVPASNSEVIEVLSGSVSLDGQWCPVVGPETEALLGHLYLPDDGSREKVRDEALAVLRHCLPPAVDGGSETGIVIGYVQSGKTMSFTAVSALACDNGYRMVIVIAGTTTPLSRQSEDRLKSDLRLLTRADRRWKHFSNPRPDARDSIQATLDDWLDADVPQDERQTVLITVMKNHTHLKNLNQLLAQLSLQGVPVLVVDDEADQAGLNSAVKKGDQSTTYRQLVTLRHRLPHHTFLQYTATPQAPLLINLIDVLSPRFAELLTPGAGYTGGKQFFQSNRQLVRTIPLAQIPDKDNVLTEPPDSLIYAMKLFLLGVAAGYVGGAPQGNRSMLVHPSEKTRRHAEYFNWVKQIQAHWTSVIRLPETDTDRQELIADFKEAYEDLAKTAHDLPSFDELVKRLPRAVSRVNVQEINAVRGKTPQVDWRADYAHILVGGAAMDRGFTVQGLTVTYMPRDAGVGNADTVQQRARFFGYKASYIGYCRVFLNPDTAHAYRVYIDHEEDIRNRLERHTATEQPLSDWKRAFFLDGSLKPTRDCVLDLSYTRGDFRDSWYEPKAPHDSQDAVDHNRAVVQDFLSSLALVPDDGHPERTEHQKHLVARNVPLTHVFEHLLLRFRTTRLSDSQRLTGLMLQVKRYLENKPDELSCIYLMSQGTQRERSTDASTDEIKNLFQGAYPDKSGRVYPGDAKIREDGKLTVQIHKLRVEASDGSHADVPALAVWVPSAMAAEWLAQDQGTAV